MSQLPLVSVITPSYNQVQYLEPAMQSVLGQDYPHLEYAVIDGASTDGSQAVIQGYQEQLSWWVSEPDRGQASAINKGIDRARGEIVAWLNSDDLYLPGAVQRAVQVMIETNAAMVFGDAVTIDDRGRLLNQLSFGDWGLRELLRFRMICQPAVFIRREAWESVGGLNDDLHFMLDHRLWIDIAARYSIQHLSGVLAASRYHREAKNAAMAAGFAEEIHSLVEVLREDPAYRSFFFEDKKHILGGAHRLAARYLLDGGYPPRALGEYLRALYYWPGYALQHGHRILYALLTMLTGKKTTPRTRARLSMDALDHLELEHWPGIYLPGE